MSQVTFASQRRQQTPDDHLPPILPPDTPDGHGPPAPPPGRDEPRWRWGKRFGLLLLVVYFGLYAGLDLVQWTPTALVKLATLGGERGDAEAPSVYDKVTALVDAVSDADHEYIWYRITPWVGRHILRLNDDFRAGPNGSGDTTHDYVRLLIIALLTVPVAVIVSFVLRSDKVCILLARLLYIAARYYLALKMLSYGFDKVIKLQFPEPYTHWLTTTFGDASPMRLVWFFMGFSEPYTIFAGAGEVLGGLLLLWRRTTTLGALIVIAVMTNVVMMNFSYDVPVKIFSSHLLAMAMGLAALDLRRLINVFVLNRAAPPVIRPPLVRGAAAAWALFALKLVLIGSLVYVDLEATTGHRKARRDAIASAPFHGLWEVESFVVNGQERPPLVTDAERWRFLHVETRQMALVRYMDGRLLFHTFAVDPAAGTVGIVVLDSDTEEVPQAPPAWTYSEPAQGVLVLEGPIGEDACTIRLRHLDVRDFNLNKRGFNWINEFPNNWEEPIMRPRAGAAASEEPVGQKGSASDL